MDSVLISIFKILLFAEKIPDFIHPVRYCILQLGKNEK